MAVRGPADLLAAPFGAERVNLVRPYEVEMIFSGPSLGRSGQLLFATLTFRRSRSHCTSATRRDFLRDVYKWRLAPLIYVMVGHSVRHLSGRPGITVRLL